jgi:hypothetical protein
MLREGDESCSAPTRQALAFALPGYLQVVLYREDSWHLVCPHTRDIVIAFGVDHSGENHVPVHDDYANRLRRTDRILGELRVAIDGVILRSTDAIV